MWTNIFNGFFKSRRNKTIAWILAGLSLASVVITVPVVLTTNSSKSNSVSKQTAPSKDPVPDTEKEPDPAPDPAPEPGNHVKKLLIISAGQSNAYGYVPENLANEAGTVANYDTPVASNTFGLDRATNKWVPLLQTNQWNHMPSRGSSASDDSKMYATATALAHKVRLSGKYDEVRIFGIARPSGGFGPIVKGKPIGNIGLDQNVLAADKVTPVLVGRTLMKVLGVISDKNSSEYIDLDEYDVWIFWQQGESDVYAMRSIPGYGELYQTAVRMTVEGFKEILNKPNAIVTIGDMTPNWRAEVETDADKAGISNALSQVVSKISNAGFVSTDGIVNVPHENGTIHYGLKAQGPLAERHLEIYDGLQSKKYDPGVVSGAEKLIVRQDNFRVWPNQNKVSGDWVKNYKVGSPSDASYADFTDMNDYVSYRSDGTRFYRFRFDGVRVNGSQISVVWEQSINPFSLTNDLQSESSVGYKLLSISDTSGTYNTKNSPLGALVPAPAGAGTYFLTIDTTKSATCWRFMTNYSASTAGGSLRVSGGKPVYDLQSTKLFIIRA